MKRIIIFLLLATAVASHTGGGADFTQDNYLIDFGWEPETPTAGQNITLTISLLNLSARSVVEFDEASVTITRKGEVAYSQVHQPDKNIIFPVALNQGGDHEINVRFKRDGNIFLEQSATIEVTGGQYGELGRYSGGMVFFIAEALLLLLSISGLVFVEKKFGNAKEAAKYIYILMFIQVTQFA